MVTSYHHPHFLEANVDLANNISAGKATSPYLPDSAQTTEAFRLRSHAIPFLLP